MPRQVKNIAILGDGGWGTTLAIHLARKNYSVKLWGPFPAYLKLLDETRENTKFLPGVKIPDDINIVESLDAAIDGSELIVLAIPSKFAANLIRLLKKFDFSKKIVLSVIKGIEHTTLMRISQIIL